MAMLVCMVFYYHYQNKETRIGGQISVAKTFWLGFASFNYFVFPVLLFYQIENKFISNILLVIIALFYLRFLVQGFLMFVTKNWIPFYGIMHNKISMVAILISIVYMLFNQNSISEIGIIFMASFLILLFLVLLTDTVYAIRFQKIVGENTQGNQAIWFAGNTEVFKKINRLTIRNNWIFSFLNICVVFMMWWYDKF